MEFFEVNLIMLVVAILFFVGAYYLDAKTKFIEKVFKTTPKQFYIITGVLALVILIMNYIAISVFGSWQSLIITSAAIAIAILIVIKLYQSRKA